MNLNYKQNLLQQAAKGDDGALHALKRAAVTDEEIEAFIEKYEYDNREQHFSANERVSRLHADCLNEFNDVTNGKYLTILQNIYDALDVEKINQADYRKHKDKLL